MIHAVTITTADETRKPPAGPVLTLSADTQNVTLEFYEDRDDDVPTSSITVSHRDLGSSLNFLLDIAAQERAEAEAIDSGETPVPPVPFHASDLMQHGD